MEPGPDLLWCAGAAAPLVPCDHDSGGRDACERGQAEYLLPARRLPPARRSAPGARLDTAYCAEVIAVSYQAMGLLPARRRPGWYDAGRFWSGDDLRLSAGARLGGEIAVKIPAAQLASSLG